MAGKTPYSNSSVGESVLFKSFKSWNSNIYFAITNFVVSITLIVLKHDFLLSTKLINHTKCLKCFLVSQFAFFILIRKLLFVDIT